MRGTGAEDDFISLSVTRRAEDQGPHPESRLVREEDELGEGDDGLSSLPAFVLLIKLMRLSQNLLNIPVPKSA